MPARALALLLVLLAALLAPATSQADGASDNPGRARICLIDFGFGKLAPRLEQMITTTGGGQQGVHGDGMVSTIIDAYPNALITGVAIRADLVGLAAGLRACNEQGAALIIAAMVTTTSAGAQLIKDDVDAQIAVARSRSIPVVWSAGNRNGAGLYPSGRPGVLSVGAWAADGRGPCPDTATENVVVFTQGCGVPDRFSGTSAAAARLGGLLARAIANTSYTPEQAADQLLVGAHPQGQGRSFVGSLRLDGRFTDTVLELGRALPRPTGGAYRVNGTLVLRLVNQPAGTQLILRYSRRTFLLQHPTEIVRLRAAVSRQVRVTYRNNSTLRESTRLLRVRPGPTRFGTVPGVG